MLTSPLGARLKIGACAVLLGIAVWSSFRLADLQSGLDYYPVWAVVRWVRDHGNADIRGHEAQQRFGQFVWNLSVRDRPPSRESAAADANLRIYGGRVETYSTPFLYALVSVGVTEDYERDYLVFSAASVVAFAAAVFAFARALGLGTAAALAASAGLLLPFSPTWSQLVTGNVELLQGSLVLFGLALFARQRRALEDYAGGFLFALAVLLKPTMGAAAVTMASVWIVERQWAYARRVATGGFAGGALGLVVGGMFFGSARAWPEWLSDLTAMLRSTRPIDPWNCSWVTFVRAVSGVDLSLPVLALLVAVTVAAVWRGRGVASTSERTVGQQTALAAAVGCGVALLASPYSWLHHYLVAAPLVLWPLRPGSREGRTWAGWLAYGLALALLFTGTHRSGLPLWVVELGFANVALTLLVVLGWGELGRPEGRPRTVAATVSPRP